MLDMARRGGGVDPALRERLAAWTEHLMRLHGIESKRAMGRRMGVSGPTVTNALNRKSGLGLDFLVALHRTFHMSADVLLDTDPPSGSPRSQGENQSPTPRGGASRERRSAFA